MAFNPIRPNDRLGFNLSNICYTVIGNVVDDMWLVNTVVHVVPIHINRLSHSIHVGKRTYAQLSMAEIPLGKRESVALGDKGGLGEKRTAGFPLKQKHVAIVHVITRLVSFIAIWYMLQSVDAMARAQFFSYGIKRSDDFHIA